MGGGESGALRAEAAARPTVTGWASANGRSKGGGTELGGSLDESLSANAKRSLLHGHGTIRKVWPPWASIPVRNPGTSQRAKTLTTLAWAIRRGLT